MRLRSATTGMGGPADPSVPLRSASTARYFAERLHLRPEQQSACHHWGVKAWVTLRRLPGAFSTTVRPRFMGRWVFATCE
jgi:hypothetical protein